MFCFLMKVYDSLWNMRSLSNFKLAENMSSSRSAKELFAVCHGSAECFSLWRRPTNFSDPKPVAKRSSRAAERSGRGRKLSRKQNGLNKALPGYPNTRRFQKSHCNMELTWKERSRHLQLQTRRFRWKGGITQFIEFGSSRSNAQPRRTLQQGLQWRQFRSFTESQIIPPPGEPDHLPPCSGLGSGNSSASGHWALWAHWAHWASAPWCWAQGSWVCPNKSLEVDLSCTCPATVAVYDKRCHEMSWDVIVQCNLFQCLSNKWSSKRWIQNCPWCQDWGGCQGRNKDRPDKFIEKYRSAMAARRSIRSLTFQPFSLSAFQPIGGTSHLFHSQKICQVTLKEKAYRLPYLSWSAGLQNRCQEGTTGDLLEVLQRCLRIASSRKLFTKPVLGSSMKGTRTESGNGQKKMTTQIPKILDLQDLQDLQCFHLATQSLDL